ncbi:MAG: LUD domain-containing protein [Sinomicrobium sp.]|nr:LUD domain-containing protein [Sinomicrobium sp.]
MRLLNKLFNGKKNKPQSKKDPETSPHIPDAALPLDEKFTINFKKNGGKFLYCGTMEEVCHHFGNILSENSWQGTKLLSYNVPLRKKFGDFDIEYTEAGDTHTAAFFTLCEYLIADTGSIMISANQIREKKLNELPEHFIVFATTSQMVENIGKGLSGIKHKYKGKIPGNITTIKHFETGAENDFLTYGSSSKNLYLLLLEDL